MFVTTVRVLTVNRDKQDAGAAAVMQYFAYAVAVDTDRLHIVRTEIKGKHQRTLWNK